MIRLSKLTDYGFIVLSRFIHHDAAQTVNARDLAAETNLPLPTVSKVLKILSRHGLLIPHRGVKGGYSLSRRPEDISVAEIISALEGPIAFTDCAAPESSGDCPLEHTCPTRGHWQRITLAVQTALCEVTLAELGEPVAGTEAKRGKPAVVKEDKFTSGCTTAGCGGPMPEACTCAHDMQKMTGNQK
jgi:FeS assembly SUF system regulator